MLLTPELSVLSDAKVDFLLSLKSPAIYKAKVNGVSDIFGLKGKERFVDDYHATYFVGDYTDGKPKDVLFGLNPGFDPKRDRQQRVGAFGRWEDYLTFEREFFGRFRDRKVPFYRYLSKFFGWMNGVELDEWKDRWDFLQANLVTVELIPYHSRRFKPPAWFSDEQLKYLGRRLRSNFDFLKTFEVRCVVFNGKSYWTLLKELLGEPVRVNKRLNMYLFECQRLPCVLFDRFVPSPAAGASYADLKKAATMFNDRRRHSS
jgi:hypothetical protein